MTTTDTPAGLDKAAVPAAEAMPAEERVGYLARLGKDIRRDYLLYLMLLPMLIWLVLFAYKPMYGLQMAFQKYSTFKGIAGSPYVGFDNFIVLFQSDQFLRALGNTLILGLYSMVFGFPVPIILAVMINEVYSARYRKTIQTIVYLPHFISVVIVAGIVISFLSPATGIINNLLAWMGFERIYFMIKPEWFRTVYISSTVWKEAGFDSIVYLAAIMGINPSLYESAQVDGASRWQMIRRITLPCIVPTIAVLLVIRLGRVLEVGWEYIILLYQPATYETADVISTYIYRLGLTSARYDVATAAGIFNALVSLVLVLVANHISRRITKTGVF
jgi:putative aldouronate transport system permease protein